MFNGATSEFKVQPIGNYRYNVIPIRKYFLGGMHNSLSFNMPPYHFRLLTPLFLSQKIS